MKIVETRVLRGPNVHSLKPCLQAVIDLEDLDDVSSAQVPGFTDRLVALLPTLVEHFCTVGRRGGFIERLREGTYMAHITEHVALELQALAGHDHSYGKARQIADRPRHYHVVMAYGCEETAQQALAHAVALVQACARDEAFSLDAALAELRETASARALGPSTRAIVEAARARGIPVMRLSPTANLFQLGWGARQQRIQATTTSQSNYVAVELASDKDLTKALLAEAGLPVPQGLTVRGVDAAVAAARDLGGAVVLKPLDANQGKGVTTAVRGDEAVRAAYERARVFCADVIVERHIEGDDHRVLVVGDRVVAASRRMPPAVRGDGARTVRQLVEDENGNPLRGTGHSSPLTRIALDDAAAEELRHQGLDADSVVPFGRLVRLRSNANLSTGGTAEDVTDRLHPDLARDCVRAARKIGLDVAGIDLVCRDVGEPLARQGGAIIEVNAAPGIRMHEFPSAGAPRSAGEAIVDSLFPGGADGRIPTVAITGSNGKTTTTLAIGHVLRALGRRTGVATTEGVFIDGREVSRGDCTGYWSARTLLTDPDVDVAVLETARGGMLKRGLAFDACDVGVVLNVQPDHLGQDGIDTLEDLAHVKALVAETARRAAVLNADDPRCVKMATRLRAGCEVIWFCEDADNALVNEHRRQGGRAVFRDGRTLWLACGAAQVPAIDLAELPFTLGGRARFNVLNAMAALAALVALDIPCEEAARAMAGFRCDVSANPLRMNAFRTGGVTVLMDYCHNIDAYKAVGETARALAADAGGRAIGVVAVPGDRRDADSVDVGEACAEAFDQLVVYEMDDRRERAPGEMAALLLAGVARAACGTPARIVLDVREAVRQAVAEASPGDVVVFGCASYLEELTDALGHLPDFVAVDLHGLAIDAPRADGMAPPAQQEEALREDVHWA